MFANVSKHRTLTLVAAVALLIGLVVAGCQLFDTKSSPTVPQETATTPQANYIVGEAEDDGWTAYYKPGDTYFKLTIPVVGVIKIHYTVIQGVQTGSTFTLVLKTTAPTTHEIGLKTFEVDGKPMTDVVDCAWVEYVENGDFASMPTNAVLEKTGKQYVQYKRETGDSETEEWWPGLAEEFVFLTDATHLIQTMKPYCQQQLLVDEGKPASRPAPIAPAPVDPSVSGELSFLLRWSCPGGEPVPDLDLHVTTPAPENCHIWWKATTPACTHGVLDLDDTTGGGTANGGPERITWPTGNTPPSGTYTYGIDFYSMNSGSCANPTYTLNLYVGTTLVKSSTGTLTNNSTKNNPDEFTTTYTLP